jgi:hypothetical protein
MRPREKSRYYNENIAGSIPYLEGSLTISVFVILYITWKNDQTTAVEDLSCLIFKCKAAKNRVVNGLSQLKMAYRKYSATPTPNTPD